MKGLYHIHSNFSFDGLNSIREIAEWAKNQGLDFIILTEHDRDFSQEKFDNYVMECKKNSKGICIVPGIEYSFKVQKQLVHTNILGVNSFIEDNVQFKNLGIFLEDVRDRGGISILNHPLDILDLVPEELLFCFDLIEIWNTKYDHDYSPNLKNLKIAEQSLFPGFYIASSDIHEIPVKNHVILHLIEPLKEINENIIISALKDGIFYTSYKDWEISSVAQIKTRYNYQHFLPIVSNLQKIQYDFLRKVAQKLNYKPSPFIVKLFKSKL